jgi:SAM-dependent methyltransferase
MPKFINKEVQFFSGAEAARKLQEVNDCKFLTEHGIVAVDSNRWEDAQHYEKKTWMELNRHSNDDHNDRNKRDLGNYSYLSGMSFDRAIEVGCGPFTNIRNILSITQIKELYLLDPLIESYLQHPQCRYAGRSLNGQPANIIASSIEDYQTEVKFNLVVMINVLPHCMDANKVLSVLWDILVPEGVLVFHEPCFDVGIVHDVYDAGHPLLVTYDFLNKFTENFEGQYRKEISGNDGHTDRYICFSGIKKGGLFHPPRQKA